MLCEKCKVREAIIKYAEMINSVKTEHNLCSHCAKKMDFSQYSALLDGEFSLRKLLPGPLGLEGDEGETDMRGDVVCPTCGTSFEDFVRNSRFGRADHYGVFDLFIRNRMKQLQGNESRKGKHPKYRSTFEKKHPEASGGSGKETEENTDCLAETGSRGSQIAMIRKQIRKLNSRLKEVARQEDYELAASYRDRTKELKKEAGVHE